MVDAVKHSQSVNCNWKVMEQWTQATSNKVVSKLQRYLMPKFWKKKFSTLHIHIQYCGMFVEYVCLDYVLYWLLIVDVSEYYINEYIYIYI